MSLDKAIEHKKEKRKPYRKSKAFDRTCCNHGSCPWCEGNRLHAGLKDLEPTIGQEDEFFCYWGMVDPSDADESHAEEQYEKLTGLSYFDYCYEEWQKHKLAKQTFRDDSLEEEEDDNNEN